MLARTIKWARRRPAIAALLGVVVVIAALGFGGVVWQWQRAEQSLKQAETNLYFNRIALAHHEWLAYNVARAAAQPGEPLRPPAVPLVTHDPYFSAWSMTDRLTDDWTRHWTGAVHAMCGLARIDGRPYRFLGPERVKAPPMKQLGVEVLPTRTLYRLEAAGVHLALTFITPALLDDLDVLARPVTYLTWDARSADGRPHDVSPYFDASAEWAVDKAEQPVVWGRYRAGDLTVLRVGSKDQPVLARAGDNRRIDWGYFTVAVPPQGTGATALTSDRLAREGFIARGALPADDDLRMPRPARDDWPVLACTFEGA